MSSSTASQHYHIPHPHLRSLITPTALIFPRSHSFIHRPTPAASSLQDRVCMSHALTALFVNHVRMSMSRRRNMRFPTRRLDGAGCECGDDETYHANQRKGISCCQHERTIHAYRTSHRLEDGDPYCTGILLSGFSGTVDYFLLRGRCDFQRRRPWTNSCVNRSQRTRLLSIARGWTWQLRSRCVQTGKHEHRQQYDGRTELLSHHRIDVFRLATRASPS